MPSVLIRCLVVFLFGGVLCGGSPRIKNAKTGGTLDIKTPLNPGGTPGARIAAVKKKIFDSNRVEVLSIFFRREGSIERELAFHPGLNKQLKSPRLGQKNRLAMQ